MPNINQSQMYPKYQAESAIVPVEFDDRCEFRNVLLTVGGITINTDVSSSQTFEVDIVAESDLVFANYSRVSGVELNVKGNLIAGQGSPHLRFVNLENQSINVTGSIGSSFNGLLKHKEGQLTLAAANQYIGDTNVENGIVRVTANQALGRIRGDDWSTIVDKGATVALGNGVQYTTPELIRINDNGAPDTTGAMEVFDGTSVSHYGDIVLESNSRIGSGNASGTLTLHGTIREQGGSRNLDVRGSGRVRLTGTGAYTGTTSVSSGILELSQPHAIASSPLLNVASGARIEGPAGLNIARTQTLQLNGSAQIANTPQVHVAGILDATAKNGGTLVLNDQALIVDNEAIVRGNVTVPNGSILVGTKTSTGFGAGKVEGNVAVQAGGALQIEQVTTSATSTTTAFLQNNNIIGAGNFRYVAFEAENYTNYNDVSDFNWNVQVTNDYDSSPTSALGGEALVADGSDIFFVGGDDDTAQYDVVFTEPGTYTWYVRTAAPGGQNDSFFGPDGNPSSLNPSARPSGSNSSNSKSRFGVVNGSGIGELKDASNFGGVSTSWDWLRADAAASDGFVTFENVVVTQQDVDSQLVFSLEFEPRQEGATLDKFVLVQTPAFTNLTDADLDAAIENPTAEFDVTAPKLSFLIDGNLDLDAGSFLELDLRAINDFDNVIVTGSADLFGDVVITLDEAYVPDVNDSFTILSAAGGINAVGLSISDGYTHAVVGNDLVVTFTGIPGDFDLDSDVDGADFLLWQQNPSIGDLADWQSHHGTGVTGLAASANIVPEPSSLTLCLLGTLLLTFQGFNGSVGFAD